MELYKNISTDTQPAFPLTVDGLIASSAGLPPMGMPQVPPGQSVVVEETTTRRVYMLGAGQVSEMHVASPPVHPSYVGKSPQQEVLALPPSQFTKYREDELYRRRTFGEWCIDFLLDHWIGLVIFGVFTTIATVIVVKIYRAVQVAGQYAHDHSTAIVGAVVGIPALILLCMVGAGLSRGGGKCPGVTMHCPIKH